MLTKIIIERISMFFLYIFIDPTAAVPAKILRKREKQLAILQLIDKFSLFANLEQLINWVEDGITKKYGRTPVQLLQAIYTESKAKSNIGAIGSGTYLGEDGIWYDGVTDQPVSESIQKITGSSAEFWTGFKDVITWIADLLKTLGIFNKSTTPTGNNPDLSDWDNPQEASITAALPYVAGGLILYYLYSATTKKKTSQK